MVYANGGAQAGQNGNIKHPRQDVKTDYARWRLLGERGRQTWHYLETDEEVEKWPQTVADRYMLGLPTVYHTYLI